MLPEKWHLSLAQRVEFLRGLTSSIIRSYYLITLYLLHKLFNTKGEDDKLERSGEEQLVVFSGRKRPQSSFAFGRSQFVSDCGFS
jgi:hypothetical protein